MPLPGQSDSTPLTAQGSFSPATPLGSDGVGLTMSGTPDSASRTGNLPGWAGNGAQAFHPSSQKQMASRTPMKPPPHHLIAGVNYGNSASSPAEEYRRAPTSRPIQALYDPTAPSSRPTSSNGIHPVSSQATVPTPQTSTFPTDGPDMSPEDLIEAKLQALSFSTGVAIGPPPVRGGNGPGPSYAKIVRRE